MLSKRRNLEDYAQNVLRAQLCKAKGEQYSHLAIATTFLLASFVTVLVWVAWRESVVANDLSLYVVGFSLMGAWSLYRWRHWSQVEQTIRDKISDINQAQGEAAAILAKAEANAEAIRKIATAIGSEGGLQAVNLKVAEQYVAALSNIARTGNTIVVPQNLTDIAGLVTTATSVLKATPKNA